MDQFTPAPAGRGSFRATLLALPVPPTVLLDTATVKPTVEPTLTDVESAVFERLRFGDAMVSGKATTTSLNGRVVPPMPESTGALALKNVVMSNSNWQKIFGFVGCGLVMPTSMGEVQLVP